MQEDKLLQKDDRLAKTGCHRGGSRGFQDVFRHTQAPGLTFVHLVPKEEWRWLGSDWPGSRGTCPCRVPRPRSRVQSTARSTVRSTVQSTARQQSTAQSDSARRDAPRWKTEEPRRQNGYKMIQVIPPTDQPFDEN